MQGFEAIEGQEIFDWAQRCNELFQKLQYTLASHRSMGTYYTTLRDYFQRFELWAGFIGAFAHGDASLDQRLRYNPEIRVLILGMLKLVERNLNHGFWFDSVSKEAIIQEDSSAVDSETSTLLAAKASLAAIQEAIDRLRRSAILIRRSRSYSLAPRVQGFARKDPAKVDEFRKAASLFVVGRLPGISNSLATQLVSSILFRRLRLLYESRHNEKLKARRIQVTPAASQPGIKARNDTPAQDLSGRDVPEAKDKLSGPQLQDALSETENSGFDAGKFQHYDDASTEVSDASTVTSIAQGYVYPPPPKPKSGDRYCACNWCADEIKVSDLDIPGWWRTHFKKDLRPYVCISEDCSEPAVYFGSFLKWRQHMENAHTPDWARMIHSSQVWYCDVSPHRYLEFTKKEDLETHLRDEHTKLDPEQRVRRLERNVLPSIRKRHLCPLCNQDILRVYELQQHLPSGHETGPFEDAVEKVRLSTDPKVRFQDVGDSSSSEDEANTDNIPPSLTAEEIKKLNEGKVARHVAGHLKSLAFLSIRYLEGDATADEGDSEKAAPGGDDGDSKASSRVDKLTERILDDFPEAGDGKLEFEDLPQNDRTKADNRALALAAKNGDEDAVRLLMQSGADLESKYSEEDGGNGGKHGQTPLSLAAEKGHKAVVKILLDGGADLESEDSSGRTPLIFAINKGHEEVVQLLFSQGAIYDPHEWLHSDALRQSAIMGYYGIARLLIERGGSFPDSG
ncbi:hypothetical protein O1611_g3959 [Lasiodiplodia mahajangana]|uniref:Uncharacterized protein n=1 Tax=Lasiodiplodia mahajangana TaxID=1108764 RepID=A0ACC2JQQ0_9PEZI|nr:hypothetical protein O1611_g3959 [Lasiodiplodia mahajangana]